MCDESLRYDYEIRNMSNKELFYLFSYYSKVGFELISFKTRSNEIQIPTLTKDRITLYLIEILRRMGSSVEEIKEIVRDYPLLQYKNGQEDFFLIELVSKSEETGSNTTEGYIRM